MTGVEFRPMTEDDFELVARWLSEPHVQEWWRDPVDVESVAAKYGPRIHGEEPTDMLIVVAGGRDVGMIQRYRVADYSDWERTLAATGIDAVNAAGIDYAIGEPDAVGTGLGAAAVAVFTPTVFDRYPDVERIVVTPQTANRGSCRVLEKAGYTRVWTGTLESDDPADAGEAALYVLDR